MPGLAKHVRSRNEMKCFRNAYDRMLYLSLNLERLAAYASSLVRSKYPVWYLKEQHWNPMAVLLASEFEKEQGCLADYKKSNDSPLPAPEAVRDIIHIEMSKRHSSPTLPPSESHTPQYSLTQPSPSSPPIQPAQPSH
jgi:hypothetical protein